MCLIWGFSYYYQEMQTIGSVNASYTIYQWTIIPILCYFITDFSMSITLTVIKARHLMLSKKLKMDEIELADYLKDHAHKKYLKSDKKPYYHPDFPMWAVLGGIALFVIIFALLFCLYARPEVRYTYGDTTEKYEHWSGFPWVMWTSLFAALLWEAISWPQFIKSLRQKDTSGISMNWAIFMPVSLTVSFSYALALALKSGEFSPDTIGALVFNGMIVNYGILILKILNRKRAKAMGLSEVQYTRKVLIPAYKQKLAAKKAK